MTGTIDYFHMLKENKKDITDEDFDKYQLIKQSTLKAERRLNSQLQFSRERNKSTVDPKLKPSQQRDTARVQLKHGLALSKRDSIDIQLNQLFESMKINSPKNVNFEVEDPIIEHQSPQVERRVLPNSLSFSPRKELEMINQGLINPNLLQTIK